MIKKRDGDEPDTVEKALKALLGTKSNADPSLLEQITKHLALIEKLRARGHSFGRIAEALQQVGMDIAENTLRLYVGRLQRQAAATRAIKPNPVAGIKPRERKPGGTNAASTLADRPAAGDGARKFEDMEAWLTAQPDENEI